MPGPDLIPVSSLLKYSTCFSPPVRQAPVKLFRESYYRSSVHRVCMYGLHVCVWLSHIVYFLPLCYNERQLCVCNLYFYSPALSATLPPRPHKSPHGVAWSSASSPPPLWCVCCVWHGRGGVNIASKTTKYRSTVRSRFSSCEVYNTLQAAATDCKPDDEFDVRHSISSPFTAHHMQYILCTDFTSLYFKLARLSTFISSTVYNEI